MSASLPDSALRALAMIAQSGQPLMLNSVKLNDDGALALHSPAPPTSMTFQFDGLDFRSTLNATPETFHCSVAGLLGTIPFSAESAYQRQSLMHSVRLCTDLVSPRIVVGTQQSLWITDARRCDEQPTQVAVLDTMVQMLARMRPFIHCLRGVAG